MSRFTFAEVVRRPNRLHAWWIEFPPRRVEFFKRRHPEYDQWRTGWHVALYLGLGVLLAAAILAAMTLMMRESGWVW